MSVDLPRVQQTPQQQDDWRSRLVSMAQGSTKRVATRERAKNPMIPDNFLDVSECGFPADIQVLPIQIPRQGVPQEMSQYRDMLNRQWLHLPWDVISSNGGADGKAVVPGAQAVDLGGGHFVVTVAGQYLMFADKKQYRDRRASNVRRSSESLQYKMESREEESERKDRKGSIRRDATNTGPMTVEELFEYEKQIGDERALEGVRID